MRAKEGFEGRALQVGRVAGREGAEELEELIAGVGGEAVGGVGDDVGVDMLGELEADREAAWAGVGIVVRDERDTGGVGEAGEDRRGCARNVFRTAEVFCGGGRSEDAAEQDAFGMHGTEAGIEAEDAVELLEDIFAEGEELGIGG